VARIGVFCLPMQSHMTLFLTLAAALRDHGHEAVFFCLSMSATRIREGGFDFRLIEPDAVLSQTLDSMIYQMDTLESGDAVKLLGTLRGSPIRECFEERSDHGGAGSSRCPDC
jgi:UDP:flavonoid glycosyltransferase YjiC (YdhE family)